MGRNIKELHPALQDKTKLLKEKCRQKGISILFGECLRTKSEQDALYAQGRTKPGNKVTNARGSTYSSQHQWGIAVDFYIDMDVDGDGNKSDDAFNNSTRLFDEVGTIAKSIGLGWGGDWKSPVDKPHLYLPDWGSTTAKLKKEYKAPEIFMRTWKDGKTTVTAAAAINAKKKYERTQFITDVQYAIGTEADGKAGTETLKKTVTVSKDINRKHMVVEPIQKRLNSLGYDCGVADGVAGAKFESAVKRFQKDNGCIPDGIITARNKTWKCLLGIE